MENKEGAKYIERIEIKGLWGRYNVNWALNADVNILVGENGTGKSTLLQTVKNLFEITENITKDIRVLDYFDSSIFNRFIVKFKGDKGESSFEQDNEEQGDPFISYRSNGKERFSYAYQTTIRNNGLRNQAANLLKEFNIYHIKTFDKAIKNETDDYKTNLDIELNRLEKEYLAFKLKTFKAAIKDKTVQRTNELFNETINRLFKATGKTLNEDDEKLSFLLDDNTPLKWLLLSSGEKQLLIILLTVLCQYEKPSVLLMDEPEISLHLRWQYELITIIKTLNPNCQIIIATHSPSIYGKGWRDKVFFINTLMSETKKETV
jgi:predicted ATPase